MMHNGHPYTYSYTLNNGDLSVVHTHNDLSVSVSQDLKITAECRASAAKGCRTLWSVC